MLADQLDLLLGIREGLHGKHSLCSGVSPDGFIDLVRHGCHVTPPRALKELYQWRNGSVITTASAGSKMFCFDRVFRFLPAEAAIRETQRLHRELVRLKALYSSFQEYSTEFHSLFAFASFEGDLLTVPCGGIESAPLCDSVVLLVGSDVSLHFSGIAAMVETEIGWGRSALHSGDIEIDDEDRARIWAAFNEEGFRQFG